MTYDKNFTRFDPLATLPSDECERHYAEVHTRFARNLLRDLDHVVSYHINRVAAEFDITGGWRQRPRAWRFVILRFTQGHALELSPEVVEVIAQDHRNFLRELRSCPVREEVLLDRRTGQTAYEKYVFEFDRDPATSPEDAERRLAENLEALMIEGKKAFGLRLVQVNHVIGEGATAPIDEPGQRPLDRMLESTTKQAYLEMYFDQQEWAEEWFAQPSVRALLQDPFFALAAGYGVEERCGVDKR